MSLSVEITNVVPLFPTRVFLQWNILIPEDGTHTVKVERSGSSGGAWTVLTSESDLFYYIDDLGAQTGGDLTKAALFSLQRQVYYRVTVTAPSGASAVSAVHGLVPDLPPVQAGLRRRLQYDQQILWRRLNGMKLAILKRKQWGARCTVCFDPTTRSVTQEHCSTCFGTSFTGGYHTPVITWGRIVTPQNVNTQTTERDVKETATKRIHLIDVPRLQDSDLIVEIDTNERYIVRLQEQTEIRRKPVHQELTVSTVDHHSIEFRVLADLSFTLPLL